MLPAPREEGGSAGSCAAASWHSASFQNLTYEIILTLGQAFEVAYQLALQAQKSRTMAASAASMIETKSSKPVPKPRVGMRKSAVRALQPPGHPKARAERGTANVFSPLGSCPGRAAHPLPLAPPQLPTRVPLAGEGSVFPSSLVGPNPGHGHHGAAAYSCSKHPVTSLCLSVCFALRPRCRCPPTLAVVTVTPAPLTVLPTYRCRPLVLESRSFRLPLSCVSGSPKCP